MSSADERTHNSCESTFTLSVPCVDSHSAHDQPMDAPDDPSAANNISFHNHLTNLQTGAYNMLSPSYYILF